LFCFVFASARDALAQITFMDYPYNSRRPVKYGPQPIRSLWLIAESNSIGPALNSTKPLWLIAEICLNRLNLFLLLPLSHAPASLCARPRHPSSFF
jgi:hypothetical protein